MSLLAIKYIYLYIPSLPALYYRVDDPALFRVILVYTHHIKNTCTFARSVVLYFPYWVLSDVGMSLPYL